MVAIAIARDLGDRGQEDRLRPHRSLSSAVRRSLHRGRVTSPGCVEQGSRLVPYVEVPKRGLKGGRTLSLSCANTIEVQGDLDGGIQPKTAPLGGG